jgi:hypothetical protein
MTSRFALLLVAAVATAQTNNLLDDVVALFSGGNTDRASELLDALQGCTASDASTSLFQEVLTTGLNATRTCFGLEIARDRVDECIVKSTEAIRLSTSPYDIFSVQALSPSDIAKLSTCAAGVANADSAIVDPFEVLVKRFLQCEIDLDANTEQKDALLEVFKGTNQMQEVSRAQLAALCSTLHFSGALHSDVVDFFSQTLRHFVAIVPARR